MSADTPELRCAPAAEARGEPLPGTAAPVRRWLLVEQPGPWGPRGLVESTVPVDVAQRLLRRVAGTGTRVLLVRRVGRPVARPPYSWALAESTPGAETLRWGLFLDPVELLDLPLDGSTGRRTAEPAYLVCTHGRRDPCCAIRGRPVAAALAARRPGQTWECTHVGGDRFAANVVVLPHGLYYGHLPAVEVDDLLAAQQGGRVLRHRLRGRSVFPAAVQAAQAFARDTLLADRVDDLAPVATEESGPDSWLVRLARGDGPEVEVGVRSRTVPFGRPLTCAGTNPGVAEHWELVSLRSPRESD